MFCDEASAEEQIQILLLPAKQIQEAVYEFVRVVSETRCHQNGFIHLQILIRWVR